MQAVCKQWRFFLIFCYLFVIYDLQAAKLPLLDDSPSSLSTVILPPTDLRGHQVENEFASQTDIVNVMTWNPPEEGTPPVAYYIYRNSTLKHRIAVISADKNLEFKDHNRKEDHTYTYFIVSVDEYKNKSAAACLIFKGPKTHLCPLKKAKLIAIEVSPLNPTLSVGSTQQFTATGIFSDHSTKDLTNRVTWTSSDPAVASISNVKGSQGLATALSPGATVITASLKGVKGSTTLTVTPVVVPLLSIEITPIDSEIADGFTQQFTAIGIFRDGTKKNITKRVKWTSTNSIVASISNAAGSKGLATGLSPGTTLIEASLDGVTGSTTLTVSTATLLSIEVTPINPEIAEGFSQQFTATGVFSDGTKENLTKSVTWTSTNPTVASISNAEDRKGFATGLSAGTTLIEATIHGVTGSTTLTVSSAVLLSIEVDPVNPEIADGFTQHFTAIGLFSDGTKESLTTSVTWMSSNPLVASISNAAGSKGLATALSPGTTLIEATLDGVTGSTTLTVTSAVLLSIEIDPADPEIADGFTQQFTAIGQFSDDTTENLTASVIWHSTNPAVAEISNAAGSEGLAIALSPGETLIEATIEEITGSTTLNVTSATLLSIEVDPIDPEIADGFTQQFTAIGLFSDDTEQNLTTRVTWTSSNTNVAEISSAAGSEGLATALSPGETLIEATINGVTGDTPLNVTPATLLSIEVDPMDPEIANGFTQQFTAIGLFSDDTEQDLTTRVTWTSSNLAIASISNAAGSEGLATAFNEGETLIEATIDGITGSTTLKVTPATLLSIEVTPVNPEIIAGFTQQFIATGLFSDHTTEDLTNRVTWTSSNLAVASISNAAESKGLAKGLIDGFSTITASLGAVSDSTVLTVSPAVLVSISVTPSNATIAAGFTLQFTAIGTLSDGTTENITNDVEWTSSNPAVAAIDNASGAQGRVNALSLGDTIITATVKGISGTANLNVSSAVLFSISVTPVNPSIAAGFSQQFTAIGTFSDSSTENLTTSVVWTSSNPPVATIENASGVQGLANALEVGSTTITATKSNVSGSTTLNVTAAMLVAIDVTPANSTVVAGVPIQFTAIGTFSDHSTENLTDRVEWTSSNLAVATIDNAAEAQGLATGLFAGSTTITATDPSTSISGNTMLTVTCPAITLTTPSPLPGARVGSFYSQTIQTSGGLAPITFTIARGTLPSGLSLSSDGVISGIANGPPLFPFPTFVVQAMSSCGSTATKSYQVPLNCVLPLFTSDSPLPSAKKGNFYSFQFTASGAPPDISFSLFSGTLPPGLALSASGLLSGTPTASGTFNFVVREGNSCGAQVKGFQITIN